MTRTPSPPPDEFEIRLARAARRLKEARRAIALTGAGLSVESGIPPFRGGVSGTVALWDRYDPMEYATIDAFLKDPEKVWVMLRDLGAILQSARPGEGHYALARMESAGRLHCVITQNVDGLHQAAGSVNVLEFHGSWRTMTCLTCGGGLPTERVSLSRLPPRCPCGGLLKPDVTLFGEIVPPALIDAARTEARACDCLLVIGTSAEVEPAAGLPAAAKRAGAFVIEINVEETPLSWGVSDIRLEAPAAVVLPRLIAEMGVGGLS